jgi:hypothetical protein
VQAAGKPAASLALTGTLDPRSSMTTEQIRLMAFLDLVGGWVTLFELSGARVGARR